MFYKSIAPTIIDSLLSTHAVLTFLRLSKGEIVRKTEDIKDVYGKSAVWYQKLPNGKDFFALFFCHTVLEASFCLFCVTD